MYQYKQKREDHQIPVDVSQSAAGRSPRAKRRAPRGYLRPGRSSISIGSQRSSERVKRSPHYKTTSVTQFSSRCGLTPLLMTVHSYRLQAFFKTSNMILQQEQRKQSRRVSPSSLSLSLAPVSSSFGTILDRKIFYRNTMRASTSNTAAPMRMLLKRSELLRILWTLRHLE